MLPIESAASNSLHVLLQDIIVNISHSHHSFFTTISHNPYTTLYSFFRGIFQAQLNGQTFPVVVPMGGVEEGQKFSIEAPTNAVTSGEVRPLVPIGHWRVSDHMMYS